MKDNVLNNIKKEITLFYEKTFKDDLLFVIIYGSWAFGLNEEKSDVDIVGVCKKFKEGQLENTIDFIKNLHKKYDLGFDEEIPYKNKVAVDMDFLKKASNGDGFIKEKQGIFIQPIVKSKEFLGSDKMAMRLLFNALTTKNIFCGGNMEYYVKAKKNALKNTVRIFYSAWKVNSLSLDEFVANLIEREGKTGQFYIGFEKEERVIHYLKETFKETFKELEVENKLVLNGQKYSIKNKEWFNEVSK